MLIRALVHVLGLRPGDEEDVDPADPGVRAALAAEVIEEVDLWPVGGGVAVGRRDGQ